jgi:hypothetical protein
VDQKNETNHSAPKKLAFKGRPERREGVPMKMAVEPKLSRITPIYSGVASIFIEYAKHAEAKNPYKYGFFALKIDNYCY